MATLSRRCRKTVLTCLPLLSILASADIASACFLHRRQKPAPIVVYPPPCNPYIQVDPLTPADPNNPNSPNSANSTPNDPLDPKLPKLTDVPGDVPELIRPKAKQ